MCCSGEPVPNYSSNYVKLGMCLLLQYYNAAVRFCYIQNLWFCPFWNTAKLLVKTYGIGLKNCCIQNVGFFFSVFRVVHGSKLSFSIVGLS